MLKLGAVNRNNMRSARSLVARAVVLACLIVPMVSAGEARAKNLLVQVSFQPASFSLQSGYRGDFGQVFGARYGRVGRRVVERSRAATG